MIVHSLEKFLRNRISRGVSDHRVDLALWAECRLFLIDPFFDSHRLEYCHAVEATTQGAIF